MKTVCVFASIVLAVSGYRIAPNPNSQQPKLVECGGWYGYFDVVYPNITGPRTIVTSSNFGQGDYASNEKCTVQFITQDQPINLRLNFTDFDLEDGYSCSYDSVCVSGYKYCGTTLDNTVLSYYVPANNAFTFTFESDYSITGSGFRVVVDAIPVKNDEEADFYYEDRCRSQSNEPSPTPIIDPYFPENTDYPDFQENTDYPYFPENTDYPYFQENTNYPDYQENTDYPDYQENTDYPDYQENTDYPDFQENTDYPVYQENTDYPDFQENTDYPDFYNDYNTGDYDYGNNENDYTSSDSGNGDYGYSNEDYTEDFSPEAEPVYEDEYPRPGK